MNELTIKDIRNGMEVSFERLITKEMEDSFRIITGDENPLHKDDTFARDISGDKFRGHVVFGMLTASFYSTLAGMYLPGKYSLIHSFEEISFKKPVFVGDKLTITGQVTDKNEDLNLIVLKAVIRNKDSDVVSRAKMKVLVMK